MMRLTILLILASSFLISCKQKQFKEDPPKEPAIEVCAPLIVYKEEVLNGGDYQPQTLQEYSQIIDWEKSSFECRSDLDKNKRRSINLLNHLVTEKPLGITAKDFGKKNLYKTQLEKWGYKYCD